LGDSFVEKVLSKNNKIFISKQTTQKSYKR